MFNFFRSIWSYVFGDRITRFETPYPFGHIDIDLPKNPTIGQKYEWPHYSIEFECDGKKIKKQFSVYFCFNGREWEILPNTITINEGDVTVGGECEFNN